MKSIESGGIVYFLDGTFFLPHSVDGIERNTVKQVVFLIEANPITVMKRTGGGFTNNSNEHDLNGGLHT